jgi:hypothetical protein
MLSFKQFLIEGGVGGHMAHPFDIAQTGKELVDRFAEAIDYIKKGSSSVKIDGINASLRLVDGKFVLDRGSAKPLDVKGVRPEDLEARFGEGHGFVEKGKKIIQIFDAAYPSTKSDLAKLGLTTNPNILLNIEYVEGKTNVVQYKGIDNFLAIHGLKEIKPKNVDKKTGEPTSRISTNIPFNKAAMDMYINKLDKVAGKYGFKVLGSVDVAFKKEPNLQAVLSQKLTMNGTTKTLSGWLQGVKIQTPLMTRKELLDVMASDKKNLSDKQLNDYLIYYATIKLGDEILQNATSPLGDLKDQEGIVVKTKTGDLFKITGSFIIKGMQSDFQKK